MGDTQHPLGAQVGRFLFLRQRGKDYAEVAKGWASPIALVSAAGKYLGLESGTAIAVGLLVPVVIEGAAFLIGWWDIAHGGLHRQTRLANETDHWKVETLDLLREIAAQGWRPPPPRWRPTEPPANGVTVANEWTRTP